MKLKSILTEATKPQINKAVKGLVDPRAKNINVLQGSFQYHLFPNLVVTKIGGDDVAVAGVYSKDGKYKWDGVWFKSGTPVSGNGILTKAQYEKFITNNKVIKPAKLTVDIIRKQGEVLLKYLTDISDKGAADLKAKAKIVPTSTSDLRVVADFLKNNLKSIKGAYFTWKKDNSAMGITLPFTFKPTIAKFEQDGTVDFYIDFTKNEISHNRETPMYDGVGRPGSSSEKFNDSKDILSYIKKEFTKTKQDTIKRFNDSEANRWAR